MRESRWRCVFKQPFGEELGAGVGESNHWNRFSTSGDTNRKKFTSKERDDETGLDYFGARYYASPQGRFTTPDPLYYTSSRPSDPQQFNLYSYVRNSRLALVDPIQQHWIPDGSGGYTVHQQNYSYDSLNRINWVGEYLNGSQNTGSQSFSYDRFGNRTESGSGTGVNNQQFSVDPNTNRLGVPSGQSGTMTYDGTGNLTFNSYSGQGQMVSDAENRMQQAWANSQWQTYTYDGDGHRVKRNVNGTETWQVYGLGGELLAEYAANASPSSPQKEYGYRNGELLVTLTSTAGDAHWLVTDQLGTPRMIADQTGSLSGVSRHDYLPFGEELFAGTGGRTSQQGYGVGDGVRQHFTQKERDNETGLDFFEARYFSSTQGRFTSIDPYNIVMETQNSTDKKEAQKQFTTYLSDPRRWNRYAYCLNNPLLYTDPNGEEVIIYYRPPSDDRKLGPLPDQGHFLIYVRNDKTGESAYFDYWVNTKTGETTLGQVDEKRLSEFASLTIQSTPEQEQAILNGIKQMQNSAPNYVLTPIGPRSGVGNVSECTNNSANLLKLGGINIRFDEKFFPTDAWNSLVRQYAPELMKTEIVDVGDRGGWRKVTSVPTPTVGQSYGSDPRGQARRVDPNATNNRELHFRDGKRLN